MDIEGFKKRYSGFSALTMKAYEITLRQLERFIGGSGEPTDEQVRTFLQGISNASYLQRNKAAIRRYYTFHGRVWPFDNMEFKRQRKIVPRGTKPENIKAILDHTRNTHEYMFIKTLYILGARASEVMSLTKDSLLDGGVRILGKGDKERIVPIVEDQFIKELEAYAKQFGIEDRMFPSSYGEYRDILIRCAEDAGVEKVTLHQLRHTRAIELLNKGMKPNELQQFLGHENPATTFRYLKVGSQDVRERLKQIEA